MIRRRVCSFTYDGAAIAKARPRATSRGGHASVYTPKRTADYETAIGLYAQQAMRAQGSHMSDEPIELVLRIFRAPLKSWSKGETERRRGRLICVACDLDNQVKAILDGLNGIVFLDDVQVARLDCERRWGVADEVEITVNAIDEDAQ